jgi:ribosome-associated protein
MHKSKTYAPSELLVNTIVSGIEEKKGKEIYILDLRKAHNAICDFFVLCTGGSDTQVNAIADSVEAEVTKQLEEKPWHVEGKQIAEWILIDYVNVVVHVFQKKSRDFYRLEDLWADAEIKIIETSL